MPISIKFGYAEISNSDARKPSSNWYPLVQEVNGVKFIQCNKTGSRFGKLVKHNFTMLDHIVQLRNSKTEALMFTVDRDARGGSDMSPPLKKAKRILIADLPDMIDLDVATDNDENVRIKVVPAANARAKLMMELTHGTIDLLTKQPKEVAHPSFVPDFECPNVVWLPGRHALMTRYFSEHKGKWATKSMKLPQGADTQDRAARLANVLQLFYDEHHSEPQ